MKLTSIVPADFLKLTDNNDFSLYKHQEEAVQKLISGKNVIVSVPTASGKTLIAYIEIYKTFLKRKKSLYIVPLRSLAMEKYQELLNLRSLGMRVTISIGDYDIPPSFVRNYDVIVCTSERADSMIHRDPDILNEFGFVILDEIHTISDESRGPKLETVISSILYLNPDIILLGLSATVSNIKEMAMWMNAETVISDFRAVPLETGIVYRHSLIRDGKKEFLGNKDELVLIENSVNDGGQCIVFRNSRRNVEKYAELLKNNFDFGTNIEDLELPLENLNDKMIDLISHGIAYHHAGLSNEQRGTIEELFKKGHIKIIVATPTLAAGVNLPARTVIIRDITRYSDGYSKPISNIEVQQMLGRAGRPKYDKIGYGYITVSSESMLKVAQNYLNGDLEPVISKMDSNSLIRFNILSLISSGMARKYDDILNFYKKTLLAIQNDIKDYSLAFDGAIYFLKENGFISEENDIYKVEPFGKITSELYIDPVTALILSECLNHEYSEPLYLYYISKTPDMIPFNFREYDYEYVENFLDKYNINDFSEESMRAAKTAIILQEWINEVPINTIAESFDIGPGDIQAKVSSADWISYSLYRLSTMNKKEYSGQLFHLNIRIKEGIKEDIIKLIEIPGVGRVRARRLFDNGYTTIEKLASAKMEDIGNIFGFSNKLALEIIQYADKITKQYYKGNNLDSYSGR